MSHSSPRTQRNAESLPLIIPQSKSSQGPRFSTPYFFSTFAAGLESAFPNIALNRPPQVVLDRECFFLNDLGLAPLDFLARDLMPVVPDLMEQHVYGIQDFSQSPWFFHPFLFDHQIGKLFWLYAAQRLAQGDEIHRPHPRKANCDIRVGVVSLLAAGWLKSLILWVIKANRVPVAFAPTTSA